MSRSPELGAALFNVETPVTGWAEVSTVFGSRVQTIGMIDVSKLERPKLVPNYTTQLLNEILPGVNGTYGGEFTIEMLLTGHGSTTDGALTLTTLETLLGMFLGAVAAAGATGTTATAGGTVTALNVAAANGLVAGSLIGPIGTIGDGRGNGQMVPITSHAANVVALITAIDAVLNNGDKVRNPANAYTIENPTANPAVTSTRWRFLSGNLQYDCRGCFPSKIELTGIGPGETDPTVKFTFGVSYFEDVVAAFPTVTAVQSFAHAPIANGSLVLKTKGTTTRTLDVTKLNARTFSVTWDLGIIRRKGHGGVNPGQDTIGASRTRGKGTVEFVIDAPDATTTPDLVTKWKSNTVMDLTYVWGAADSLSGALFMPYVVSDGNQPTQFDSGGIQSYKFTGRFGADNTKTTDLERSALRIAQG